MRGRVVLTCVALATIVVGCRSHRSTSQLDMSTGHHSTIDVSTVTGESSLTVSRMAESISGDSECRVDSIVLHRSPDSTVVARIYNCRVSSRENVSRRRSSRQLSDKVEVADSVAVKADTVAIKQRAVESAPSPVRVPLWLIGAVVLALAVAAWLFARK